MADRLSVIRLQPAAVIDWSARLGASSELLRQAYPKARQIAVEDGPADPAPGKAAPSMPWWSMQRWRGHPEAPQTAASLAAGAGQLLWSNMGLHACADPQAEMRAWHRVMAVDGFLMFSTLGPGSLAGLRALYAQRGWPPPFAPFVDMHDLGDMLIEAGFADPVMDQETVTLTWAGAGELLTELRQLGGNASRARFPGLRTPRWQQALLKAIDQSAAADGRVALEFEIVYGHAFRPPPRPRLTLRTEVPLDDMRAMARAGRRPA